MFSAILKYSIGSLLYGGLITVLFLSLFIFLIKGWYKDAVFKPVSYAVLGVLSLIIIWNSTIICGALAMKSDISSIQDMVENAIDSSGLDMSSTVSTFQSNEIFRDVLEEHPILYYYADSCDFSGHTITELPAVLCDTLRSYLNGIITGRLLWSLLFVVIAAIAVIKTMGRKSTHRPGRRQTGRTHDRVASRYGGRRKSSRI